MSFLEVFGFIGEMVLLVLDLMGLSGSMTLFGAPAYDKHGQPPDFASIDLRDPNPSRSEL